MSTSQEPSTLVATAVSLGAVVLAGATVVARAFAVGYRAQTAE
jgi:hypothetical protein